VNCRGASVRGEGYCAEIVVIGFFRSGKPARLVPRSCVQTFFWEN